MVISKGGTQDCISIQFLWQISLFLGRNLVRGSPEGVLVRHVVFSPKSDSCFNLMGTVQTMEVTKEGLAYGEIVVEDNFTTIQKLVIKVNALNSTVTFALETLAQHRVLVGQLQDKVDFLRRQGESLQQQLEQRKASFETSTPSMDTGCSLRQEVKGLRTLLDLNVAVAPPEEEVLKREEV